MSGRLAKLLPVVVLLASVAVFGRAGRAQDLPLDVLFATVDECTNVQCTQSSQEGPRLGFFANVLVTADGSVDTDDVTNALDMWNRCSQGGAKSPQFSTNPATSGYRVDVSLQPLNAAGDGHCGTRSGNHITIYNFTEVGGQPFPCGDPEITLAHELGHWLGLRDSPNCQACATNIMTWLYSNASNLTGRSVLDEDCRKADENWNMRGEPGGPDPADRIGRLGGICDLVPEVCVDENGNPGSAPWWIASDTTPTLECVTTTSFYGFPYRSETTTWCQYQFMPVFAPEAAADTEPFSVYGPTVSLDPISGPVSGNKTFTGWATHTPSGVARVAFWIDEQPTSLVAVRGLGSTAPCAGDPACPNVGFSTTLDTRTLANGTHTLSAVAAEARPIHPGPSRFDLTFEVANCLDTTPPGVSWTAPAAGATVVGSTTLQATATDNVGVTNLEFYLDNVRIGSDATAPYTLNWNSATTTNGSHQLKARAYDACGNVATTSPVSVTVVIDTGLPSTSITAPAAAALVRGTVTVQASAADANGIAKVEFGLDGALVATDTTPPYSFSWNTASAAAGGHSLTARAYDTSGNVGNSSVITVTVDNTAPSQYIDIPAGGATVSGAAVQVQGWATDANRVVSLAFQLDGATLTLNAPYTYGLSRSDVCSAVPTGDANCPNVGWRAYFDSTRFGDGGHTLTVTATDGAGNPFSVQRSFTISNPPNAPTGLSATVLSTTSVRLNWTDASSNETQFEVQRRTLPSGAFAAIATTAANAVTYTDATASPGTSYEYRVAAKNAAGASFSNVATATTMGNGAGYLGCYTDSSTRALPVQLPGTTNTIESCKLAAYNAGYKYAGLQYYGYCFAGNALGYAQVADSECNTACTASPTQICGGAWRNSIYSTGYVPLPPAAPSGLAASYNSTTRQFTLTWNDNSNNEQGFAPQSSYSGSAFYDLANPVGANVTTYTSSANPPVGSYQFRVRAYNAAGSSTYSNTVSLVVVNPDNGAGYLGCYTDSSTRALPVHLPGTTNTIESCKQAAFSAGYKYAGLQYYGECFAGNALGYVQVADSECNTACTASPSQICGGAWRNSIYSTGYVPPQPATSIAWIQPAENAWGPAGTLTAAGYATNGTGTVTLVWRERSSTGVWGAWNTVAYSAPVSADTTWSNTISSGSPTNKCHWFDAYTMYSGVTSAIYHYTGTTGCP